jgi:hypothetical protein
MQRRGHAVFRWSVISANIRVSQTRWRSPTRAGRSAQRSPTNARADNHVT